MVFADLKAFDEPERLTQPTHRAAHIGIDEDRDGCRARDRSVRQHVRAAYERATRHGRSVLLCLSGGISPHRPLLPPMRGQHDRCRRPARWSGGYSSIVVPTVLIAKASWNRLAILWTARQPVQCAGTSNSGENSASA